MSTESKVKKLCITQGFTLGVEGSTQSYDYRDYKEYSSSSFSVVRTRLLKTFKVAEFLEIDRAAFVLLNIK